MSAGFVEGGVRRSMLGVDDEGVPAAETAPPEIRQQHGILAGLAVPARRRHRRDGCPYRLAQSRGLRCLDRHPHRDALTASEVHQAVDYRPVTRYDLAGGYLNLPGLTIHNPNPDEETS